MYFGFMRPRIEKPKSGVGQKTRNFVLISVFRGLETRIGQESRGIAEANHKVMTSNKLNYPQFVESCARILASRENLIRQIKSRKIP